MHALPPLSIYKPSLASGLQEGMEEGLHFCGIIDPCCFQHRRLWIPNKFITNVGCKLSSPALLKLPSGKEWQVELEEHNGQFWFQNGWHEFMEHHSVRVSHLLIFRFDGNSRFSVSIFDNTACEICYPSDQLTHENGPLTSVKQESQDDGFMENSNFHPTRKVVAESDDNETSKPNYLSVGRKRANTNSTADHASCKKRKTISNQPSNPICIARNKKMVTDPRRFTSVSRREQAVIAARKFTSEYPFCTVTMKPSNVHRYNGVVLPISFAREHLKEDIKSVTLRVSDGRTWQIHYSNKIAKVRLAKGWRAFVSDNYLEEDDICIFELVSKRQWELKVTIIRVQHPNSKNINSALSKNSSCNPSYLLGNNGMGIVDTKKKRKLSDSKKQVKNEEVSLMADKNENVDFRNAGEPVTSEHFLKPWRCIPFSEKWQAITAARMFTSEYPFCTVTMRSSHVHGICEVSLPIGFARSYLKEDVQSVTLRDSDGKTWKVSCSPRKHQARLIVGWKVFVLDNYLKEDDICIFELVDNKHWEFKVTFFRIQDSKLNKRVLTQCKNLSCNPGLNLGNRRLQNENSGDEKEISDSKEEMENEVAPFMIDSKHIPSKLLSESWKFISFTGKERAIMEARTFTSVYPYCSVTMKPSYVHGKFMGRLPLVFTRAYLKIDILSVTLRVSGGRIWKVRCCSKSHQFIFYGGWKQFVLDNYLEEDDICIFELVDKRHWELKVTIFRVQDPNLNKRSSARSKNSSFPSEDNGMYIGDTEKKRDISGSKKHIETEDVHLMVNEHDKVNFPITGEFLSSELSLKPRGCASFVEKQQALAAARMFTSVYPFCTVTIKPSNVHGLSGVNLPIAFARSYLKEDIHSVTLRVSDEKTWKVQYWSKKGQVMLKTGWKAFVLDNYLEEDDICIFELVDNKQWELRVTIFSIQDPKLTKQVLTQCRNISSDPGSLLGNKKPQKEVSEEKRKFSDSKEEKGNKVDFPYTSESITSKLSSKSRKLASFSKEEREIIEARMFSSIHPYCSVILKPSNVHGQFMLHLPAVFTRAYLKKGAQSVTLRVSDGRIWQVWCSVSNYSKFYKGWKEFVLDNYLEEGDICFFELVDRKDMELKVTIFSVQDSELRKRIPGQSNMSSCLPGEIGMQNEDTGEKRKEEIENEEVSFMVDTDDNVDLPNTGESIIFTDPLHSSNRTDEKNSASIKMSVLKGLVEKQEEDREMSETIAFASDKPFCIVTVRSSNVQGDFTLNLPRAFATKYLKNSFHGVTFCGSNGTTWHAGDNCKLYKGWKEFVLDNNVKEGDVCLFELVDRNHMELKVSIQHVDQHSKQEEYEVFNYNFQGGSEGGQSNGIRAAKDTVAEKCTKQETSKQGLSILGLKHAQHVSIPSRQGSLQEKERLIAATSTFTSKNPFCVVIMRRSYVDGRPLSLPSNFSKRYLTKGKKNATLRSSNGRSFPVRIGFDEYQIKLRRGWSKFVLGNQLEEDDICIFELVDMHRPELKVTIFRLRDLQPIGG